MSADIVERRQEWWSMDTVQRAAYVDDLIARIEALEAALVLVAKNVDAMCCMSQENVDEIQRLVGKAAPKLSEA
jgi:hypothetical protein